MLAGMRLTFAACWLSLVAWIAPAAAQTAIHRCIDAHGHPLFTDQPCMALQATPVNPAPTAPGNQSSQPPPVMCAATLAQLRQSVMDAFTHHDENRMAGLMLWNGYGSGAAVADIRSLGSLMRQPLLDIDPSAPPGSNRDALPTAGSSAAANTPDPPPSAGSQLVLHTTSRDGNGSPAELRLDVVHQAGCLWLRYPD